MSIRDSKWFCSEPFSNVFITTDGIAAPCCVSGNWKSDQHQTHNIRDWEKAKNSSYFKGLRSDLMKGEGKFIDDYCKWCLEKEQAGQTSHRQMYVERLTEEEINLIDKTYVDGEDFDFPVIKNIQIKALGGNYCNLSCHMCHASESSGLALENRKLGIPDNHPLDRPAKYSFPWNQEGLEEYLRKTQRLNLVGGETLAIKENYDLLKKCILMGVAKNIEVQIITNATVFPVFDDFDILDYIAQFKSMHVVCSVEIWGKENDYIRYPSKWEETKANIYKLVEAKAEVVVASTVNALNIGYLHKMDFPKHSFMAVVDKKNPFSITSIPPDIRKQLQILSEHEPLLESYEYDEKNMLKMLDIIKLRDNFRNTKLTDFFPEWDRYY